MLQKSYACLKQAIRSTSLQQLNNIIASFNPFFKPRNNYQTKSSNPAINYIFNYHGPSSLRLLTQVGSKIARPFKGRHVSPTECVSLEILSYFGMSRIFIYLINLYLLGYRFFCKFLTFPHFWFGKIIVIVKCLVGVWFVILKRNA